jgi:hypothetical protein
MHQTKKFMNCLCLVVIRWATNCYIFVHVAKFNWFWCSFYPGMEFLWQSQNHIYINFWSYIKIKLNSLITWQEILKYGTENKLPINEIDFLTSNTQSIFYQQLISCKRMIIMTKYIQISTFFKSNNFFHWPFLFHFKWENCSILIFIFFFPIMIPLKRNHIDFVFKCFLAQFEFIKCQKYCFSVHSITLFPTELKLTMEQSAKSAELKLQMWKKVIEL